MHAHTYIIAPSQQILHNELNCARTTTSLAHTQNNQAMCSDKRLLLQVCAFYSFTGILFMVSSLAHMVGRHICTLPMTSHLSLEHTLVGLWLMRLVQTGMPSIAIVDLCDDANSNIFPSLLLTLTRGMHIPTETLIFHSPALGRRSHHIPAILHNGTGGRKVVSGVGLRGRAPLLLHLWDIPALFRFRAMLLRKTRPAAVRHPRHLRCRGWGRGRIRGGKARQDPWDSPRYVRVRG